MVINKRINLKELCDIVRPLSYEYDTSTKSIVLLRGYLYNIMYEKSKLVDTIDLREISDKPYEIIEEPK